MGDKKSVKTFKIHKNWKNERNKKQFAVFISLVHGIFLMTGKTPKKTGDRWYWYERHLWKYANEMVIRTYAPNPQSVYYC